MVFDRYHIMKDMGKAVDTVRKREHRALLAAGDETLKRSKYLRNILTCFAHRITNAVSEGLNSKIETVKKMACGFRTREHFRTAIYFHCGGLDLYAAAYGNPG